MKNLLLRDTPNLAILIVISIGIFVPYGINTSIYYRNLTCVGDWWCPWEANDDTSKPVYEYEYTIYSDRITEEYTVRDGEGEILRTNTKTIKEDFLLFFLYLTYFIIILSLSGSILRKNFRGLSFLGRTCFVLYALAIHSAVSSYDGKDWFDLRGLFCHEEFHSDPNWLDGIIFLTMIIIVATTFLSLFIHKMNSKDIN